MVTRQRSTADGIQQLATSSLRHGGYADVRYCSFICNLPAQNISLGAWCIENSVAIMAFFACNSSIASCAGRTCKSGFVTKIPDRIRRRRTMGSCQSMLLQSHHDFWLYACWSSVTVTKSFGGHWKISYRSKSNCIKHVAFWIHRPRQQCLAQRLELWMSESIWMD